MTKQLSHQDIEDFSWKVRSHLQKAEIKEAIETLSFFLSNFKIERNSSEVIALSARYYQNESSQRKNIEPSDSIQLERNKIIFSTLDLLNEIRQNAIDNITSKLSNQLENIAKKGEEAVNDMNRINILMAESRLLELEAWSFYAGLFPGMDKNKVEKQIEAFKEILGKIKMNNPDLTK
jgi:hypothetical protein